MQQPSTNDLNNKLQDLRRIQSRGGGHTTILIVGGSILDYIGDAFVNAANEGCTGGFGVDEQVNRAGGFELKEARKLLGGCPTGEAKVTESFDHKKVKHIIHAVGPVYRLKFGMSLDEDHSSFLKAKDPLLVDAYKASLARAQELGVETLGFTLLSAGVFRGERELKDILQLGLKTIVNHCYEGLKEVTMVAWTKEEQDALVELADDYLANPQQWEE